MKKLMIGLVGACALAVSAQAEVASENIVGYNAKEIIAGNYNMFSVPFKATDAAGFSLNKNLSLKNATASENSFDADQILIWDAATSDYDVWYLYPGDGDEYPYGWYNFQSDDWFDDAYPDGLPAGTTFWYLAKGTTASAEVTFSGEVDSASLAKFTLVKGNYNMIANPYPQKFSINTNLELTGATASENSFDADQILIWDAATSDYDVWYLYPGDGDEYPYGWYNFQSDDWFDDVYPDGLPVGTAFWYLAKGGEGTLTATFTK